jgi:DNA-binding transcriptional regulator LsrR (DeoR family)
MAKRFYVKGGLKLEIADEFGMNRFEVVRMLNEACDHGLVRIEFDLPSPIDVGTSDEARRTYQLNHTPALERGSEQRDTVRKKVDTLAARLLKEVATPDDVIGLSWNRSVNAMTEVIRVLPRCPIVQPCGVQARTDMRGRSAKTVSLVSPWPAATPTRSSACWCCLTGSPPKSCAQPGIGERFTQRIHRVRRAG